MRMCMFCLNKASTCEDAWPLWLMKHFPTSSTAHMNAEIGGWKLDSWSPAKPSLRVKRLCPSCNNGWMSRLESETKPVLESILDDQLKDLDTSAQLTLARWAVKTAMVLEATDSNRCWFYSEDDRQLMRKALDLPQRTSVWIAKCVNQPNIYSAAKHLRTTPGDDGVHMYATTMAFGSLALQVESIRTPSAVPENVAVTYDVREGDWDQTLVQVWPASQNSRAWPPYCGLDGDWGLDALTNRVSPATR